MFKDNTENAWLLIESYFRNHHLERLVRHQIDSYNYFINNQMQKTIDMFNPITNIHSENDYNEELDKYALDIVINMENMKLHRPQIHENSGATSVMLPLEARLRNFTYTSSMTIDVVVKYIIREGPDLSMERTVTKTKRIVDYSSR